MSYRLIPHHIYYFSDIEICIVWRKIGVWRGTDTSQSQYLSHFIYPNSSLLGLRRNDYLFHSVVFRMASYASILEFHIDPSH